jgi:hypothetical protein
VRDPRSQRSRDTLATVRDVPCAESKTRARMEQPATSRPLRRKKEKPWQVSALRVAGWSCANAAVGAAAAFALAGSRSGPARTLFVRGVALNGLLASSVFLGSREVLARHHAGFPIQNSAAAGALTGGVCGAVVGGPLVMVQAAVAASLGGAAWQLLMVSWRDWREARAVEVYERQRKGESYPATYVVSAGNAPQATAHRAQLSAARGARYDVPPVAPVAAVATPTTETPSRAAVPPRARSSAAATPAPASASQPDYLSYLPSWFPVKRIDAAEEERALRERIRRLEELLGDDDPQVGSRPRKQSAANTQPRPPASTAA